VAEDWIAFHSRLASGRWQGVPREYRFVLLELALCARRENGTIFLPRYSKTHTSGIVELLGGNRAQTRRALKFFASEEPETMRFVTDGRLLSVVLDSWGAYNFESRSTIRSRKKRERDKGNEDLGDVQASHGTRGVASRGTGPGTVHKTGQDRTRQTPTSPAAVSFGGLEAVWAYFLSARETRLGKRSVPKLASYRVKILARLKSFSLLDMQTAIDEFWHPQGWNVESGNTAPKLVFRSDDQVQGLLDKAANRSVDNDEAEPRARTPRPSDEELDRKHDAYLKRYTKPGDGPSATRALGSTGVPIGDLFDEAAAGFGRID